MATSFRRCVTSTTFTATSSSSSTSSGSTRNRATSWSSTGSETSSRTTSAHSWGTPPPASRSTSQSTRCDGNNRGPTTLKTLSQKTEFLREKKYFGRIVLWTNWIVNGLKGPQESTCATQISLFRLI